MHPDARPATNLRRLALQTLAAIVALSALAGALLLVFGEPLRAVAADVVGTAGAPGLGLAMFLIDATALPMPPELLFSLALAGGLSWTTVVVAASTGSILGGSTAWALSQLARRIPPLHRRLEARSAEARELVERYGVLAIALGALTPIPYSLSCWACGVLGIPFRQMLLASLFRIPYVMIFAGGIALGLWSVG